MQTVIVIVLVACSLGVDAERTPNDRVMASGSLVDFISPCATEYGVFSKIVDQSTDSETIWANGTLVAKHGRYAYANATVFIRDSVYDDTGSYMWKCYGNFGWSKITFHLDVRDRLVNKALESWLVGYTGELFRPCLTDVGSFSKSDGSEPIWRNGVVAANKSDKFFYDDRFGMLYLKSCVLEDAGEYVWTCDNPPNWKTKVLLFTRTLTTNKPAAILAYKLWISSAVCGPIVILAILAFLIYARYDKWCSRKKTRKVPNEESVELSIEELPPTYQDVISAVNDSDDPPAYHLVTSSRV